MIFETDKHEMKVYKLLEFIIWKLMLISFKQSEDHWVI